MENYFCSDKLDQSSHTLKHLVHLRKNSYQFDGSTWNHMNTDLLSEQTSDLLLLRHFRGFPKHVSCIQ